MTTPVQETVEEVREIEQPEVSKTSEEEQVREYFSDLPIMIDIAWCESKFKHTTKNAKVVRGEVNPYDVGVMQINEKYHLKTSKKLDIDIYSIEGNMEYARYLYEKEGARPWLSSSHCWANYTEIAKL